MGIFDKEVIDITHRSGRTQAGNLIAAGVIKPEEEVNPFEKSPIPQNITLETAINWFEENAKEDYRVLYKQTAKWLKEYLAIPKSDIRKMKEASSEGEE